MQTQQTRHLSTPGLEQLKDQIRQAYRKDIMDLAGQEQAFNATITHIVSLVIRDLETANRLVMEMVNEGTGLCVFDHSAREALPTIEEIDNARRHERLSGLYPPLDLTGLVREIVRKHLWEALYDELKPLRQERGELD